MAIIQVTNQIAQQISTTIGTVPKGKGMNLSVQIDQVPIAKALYDELEGLKVSGKIAYEIIQDPNIRNEIENAPFYFDQLGPPPIGTPIDGDYLDGKLTTLVPETKLPDAIDLINKELLSATSGGGAIGAPTDGTYTDGFFDTFTPTTLTADAIDEISESFLELAPAKAGTLIGQALVLSGTTQFSAKIPTGLASNWSLLTPGNTITNLIVDGTFRLDNPDLASRFRAGKKSDFTTAGILTHVLDGANAGTYNIGVNGVGTIGLITIDALDIFNTFWLKANAHLDIVLATEGRSRHALTHSEAGLSSETELYFDDVNTTPTFGVALVVALNIIIAKWLSGIQAWGFGTTLDISYTAASGIFQKTYHPTAVGQLSGTGHTTSIDNPGATPAVADTFAVSRTIILDNANQASLTPALTANIQKPDGTNANSVDNPVVPINTYGTVSTTKADDFFDEVRRIVLGSGTTSGTATSFVSTASLVNGNAQQRHSGILQFPDATDYPAFTGDQEYQRFIAKVAASVGALTFTGMLFSDIDPFGTGDLNVLIELAVQGIFFDLGSSIGSNNGTGSGNSRANSKGARNDGTSSGGTLAWSLGTDSTALNNSEYRLIIIFRNTNHSISRISEA